MQQVWMILCDTSGWEMASGIRGEALEVIHWVRRIGRKLGEVRTEPIKVPTRTLITSVPSPS